MSFSNNRTFELFRSFMPERKAIKNTVNADIICMQSYPGVPDFAEMKQDMEFEKLAAVEVSDFNDVPTGMETYTMPGGLYAVFLHKGAATDLSTFEYIFKTWLPNSKYELDQREHFEVLGEKYKNNDPTSEEDIWVPVRER